MPTSPNAQDTVPIYLPVPHGSDPNVILGRFRLGAVIGHGGMATVYRALDVATGEVVAVKVLARHLVDDPVSRRRLLAEADAVARVPHAHIVRLVRAGTIDAGPREGEVALVMEYVAGETLRDRLARGPLAIAEALEIATQTAQALAAAHGRGVIHRDVKPANILLTAPPAGLANTTHATALSGTRGRSSLKPPEEAPPTFTGQCDVWVKLADFGLARSVDGATTYTGTGLVIGSAPYMAPELLRGKPATAAADVYALGVTLFQMLAGRLPFEAPTAAALLSRRLAEDAPEVLQYRPDVPRWLNKVVARTLAGDPGHRLADAVTLISVLHPASTATTARIAFPAGPRSGATFDGTRTRVMARPSEGEREGGQLGSGARENRSDERPSWVAAGFACAALAVLLLTRGASAIAGASHQRNAAGARPTAVSTPDAMAASAVPLMATAAPTTEPPAATAAPTEVPPRPTVAPTIAPPSPRAPVQVITSSHSRPPAKGKSKHHDD